MERRRGPAYVFDVGREVVMMVAMMLPSATPMILLFASVNRRREVAQDPLLSALLFAGSYVVVWAGFAMLATAAGLPRKKGVTERRCCASTIFT